MVISELLQMCINEKLGSVAKASKWIQILTSNTKGSLKWILLAVAKNFVIELGNSNHDHILIYRLLQYYAIVFIQDYLHFSIYSLH